MKLEEVIVGILIVIVIGITLMPKEEEVIPEPITEIPFESYPLKAWRDGRVVKMVGIAHTTTPHEIIYDTVQESLD